MIILFVLTISTNMAWTNEIETREVNNKEYGLNPSQKPFQAIPDMDYPSEIIFGFIKGCQEQFARIGAFSNQLWPQQLYTLCGCMMDYTRKEIPYDTYMTRFRNVDSMSDFDRKWIGEKLQICLTSITKSWAQNEGTGNEN